MRIDEEQNRRDKNGFWLHVESKVKVNSRQLGNSHLTNEPEADGVLILRHSLHQSSITKLLQATRKGRKSKEGFEVINGDRNRDILPRRPRPKQLR